MSFNNLQDPLLEELLNESKESPDEYAKSRARQKRRIGFGYLPLWSECLPLDFATGKIDWPGVVVNFGTGLLMGLREALGGIVSASMVFSSSGIEEISAMLPFGIGMTLYTMAVGVLWYALFGRLQYGYGTQQDLICILQAQLAAHAAEKLGDEPEKIPATVVAIICLSAVLTGAFSVLVGKLGLGSYMLLVPSPVTNGFLGAIGVVVVRAGFQTACGVKFHYFYPTDFEKFCSRDSMAQMCCMLSMVACIRLGPWLLSKCFPGSKKVERLAGLGCQLLPIIMFYIVVGLCGVSLETLAERGWTYPSQGNSGPMGLWTTYSPDDVDMPTLISALPDMAPIVMMSILCTMLGVLAITEKFPTGPEGDPNPLDTIDFDMELATVGACSMFLGLSGGNLVFHKFSVIQLRLDGGTHRIAVATIALFAGGLFLSGVPIGALIPKWFLAGLFLNTGVHFLKGTLLSYKSLARVHVRGWQLPSPQYIIAPCCVVVAIFFSPIKAIGTGMVLSVLLFLHSSSTASPVTNVCMGDRVVSRLKRPFWEMRALRRDGDRIVLLYLQGQLFFGSARRLVAALSAASAGHRVRFCILSFSRVPVVDPSAARHIKTAADKMRQRGCQIIFCRMNHEVYATLSAAKVVKSPDEDLVRHYEGKRWKVGPAAPPGTAVSPRSPKRVDKVVRKCSHIPRNSTLEVGFLEESSKALDPVSPAASLPDEKLFNESPSESRRCHASEHKAHEAAMRSPPSGLDAFTHETDALDYCDEQIIAHHCYGPGRHSSEVHLEPYMLAYRAAVSAPYARLAEWAFEDMNLLPRGFMGRLRKFCSVHVGVPAWTKLSECSEGADSSLCFMLKGSMSVIQEYPVSDGVHDLEPAVQGFSFRQGKRLLKRYPPGHIAGKHGFFLKNKEHNVDDELTPKMIVSSKLGAPAEFWLLHSKAWAELPADMKTQLTETICVQFADSAMHSRLQEH